MSTPNSYPSRAQIEQFVKKHKIALGVGAAVLILIMMADDGGGAEGVGPVVTVSDPGGAPVYAPMEGGGGGGGFEAGPSVQGPSDIEHRRRIDAIREVERCYDPETGTTVEVSIHVGCS